MSNGEMIAELRRMAAQEKVDHAMALQLLMAAQADMLEKQAEQKRALLAAQVDMMERIASHNHDARYAQHEHEHSSKYAPCDHDHDELYASKSHDHPFAYLTAGISAIAAAAAGILWK